MTLRQRYYSPLRARRRDANLLGISALILAAAGMFALRIVINAFLVWVILEQFDYSLEFWNYIWIGAALSALLYNSKE